MATTLKDDSITIKKIAIWLSVFCFFVAMLKWCDSSGPNGQEATYIAIDKDLNKVFGPASWEECAIHCPKYGAVVKCN